MLYSLDCESYPNYFLLCIGGSAIAEIRGQDNCLTPAEKHNAVIELKNNTTYGFNSNSYDIPMVTGMMMGMTAGQLNAMSHWIISENARIWATVEKYELESEFPINHIDLIEPSPGVFIGLKKYACRLHSHSIQDLPYPPEMVLNEAQMDSVREYCLNDLKLTEDLYRAVEERITLRERLGVKYKIECRSKSDAQIAEAVIRHELGDVRRAAKLPPGHTFRYSVPEWMVFTSVKLNELLGCLSREEFKLDGSGKVALPKWLEPIEIGSSKYKLGIGGLHSMEKKQSIVPTDGQLLIDADVASYYPSIILNEALYPTHLGSRFLNTYEKLVEQRLKAKADGDDITAGGLKITINGAFGKLASKYSFLYSPDLMLAVTLTGQLALLMLIEQLEGIGVQVVSANTDGVVGLLHADKKIAYDIELAWWETQTGFKLETTQYSALYSRDVNNYLAVKQDSFKGKGIFSETGLMKDPAASIIHEAAIEWLVNGVMPGETIRECDDIRKFIIARNCKDGAQWRDQYLGKTVRWIWSTSGDPIISVKSGNKVSLSDDAYPVMTLPERIPRWIYKDKYIEKAYKLLTDCGVQT